MNEERGLMLQYAAEFLVLQESGSKPEFPQQLAESLLSSKYGDNWRGGLYLLYKLPREQIVEYFFSRPATFPAFAVFLAAGLAARDIRSESRAFAPQPVMSYLTDQWRTPEELLSLTLNEYESLANLLRQSTASEEHKDVTVPNRPLGVIVHGTWAAKEKWWRPNIGPFWKHVRRFWPHLYAGLSPFAWSGKNSHAARVLAAQQLVAWAQAQGATSLDIIAHSHGGNVCLLAAKFGLRINRLILLGTPIRTEYMLDLKRTGSIVNVFSLADLVQTPIGTVPHRRFEGRTLGDSTTVSNLRAERNGSGHEPGHSELHEPKTWTASTLDALLT
jgi:hypothetical protein